MSMYKTILMDPPKTRCGVFFTRAKRIRWIGPRTTKPTSRVDGITAALEALLTPESAEAERVRDERKRKEMGL